jgi:hypothetical protein
MLAGFSFLHDGRTYQCCAADGPMGPGEPWWWFTVTRDANRYAPFRAASKDTRASVQARIVAYYKNHLEHRAMPEREHWARRPKPGAPGVTLAAAAAGAAANRARVAAENAARVAAEAAAAKPPVAEKRVASKPMAVKRVAVKRVVAKASKRTVSAPASRRRVKPAAAARRAKHAAAGRRTKPVLKRVASRSKGKGR